VRGRERLGLTSQIYGNVAGVFRVNMRQAFRKINYLVLSHRKPTIVHASRVKNSRTMDAGKNPNFSSISATKDGLQATRYKSTDPFYRNEC
jgi:hypothetical protein